MDANVDVTDVIIETERLLLRHWQEGDLNDLFEYASVEGVGENAGWFAHKSIDKSKEILELFLNSKYCFAIVNKENNKVIGSIDIQNPWTATIPLYDSLKIKAIGYVLSKEYWGKGLMAEATKCLIKYCFDELKLDAIAISHFDFNDRSRRVIEKCGFEYIQPDKIYAKEMDRIFDGKNYLLYR